MKILIIHASAGSGHLMAAKAIYNGIKKYTDHDVQLVDALDYTSGLFKKTYRDTYTFLISKVPKLWAFFFWLLDIPALQPLIRFGRRIHNFLWGRPLSKFLKHENFDYIISTHFMSNEVSSAAKRSGTISSRIISVVTDYDVHRIWLASHVNKYAVASEWTKRKITSLGIKEKDVFVTGIPTDEKFSKTHDISVLKTKIGIKPDIFTVLIATGSFGFGPIEQIIHAIKGIQVVVVCGHNNNLYQRLCRQNLELVKVFGLVDNMHELMAVSDAMVTKPGGLSITEALVSQLPMIFFSAIPGQEANNIKVLKEHGIGISDKSIEEIATELDKLKTSKDAFLTALKKTKALARPGAVRDIIALLESI